MPTADNRLPLRLRQVFGVLPTVAGRHQGVALGEAVATAARQRLRPVLMTSLATLLGLIPMALKLGTGSEAYAPLARAIIGGLLVSVVVTVYLVPAGYLWFHRKDEQPANEVPA